MHHFCFVCDSLPGSAGPSPSSPEISECRFFARAELPRPISDFTIRRIDDALAGRAVEALAHIGPGVWFD